MPVPTPDSGTTVDVADVVAQHTELIGLVNALAVGNIGRHALGPQHVPSAVVGSDSICSVTNEPLIWDRSGGPPSDEVVAETTADISGGLWKILNSYTLDNGGAGYTLPPCKVLVFFNCRVDNFEAHDRDNQLWVNVYHSEDTVEVYDLTHGGMIHPIEQSPSGDPVDICEEPIAISFIIDKTANVGNWDLDFIKVKAGLARGGSNVLNQFDADIIAGSLTFIAFYKDE
jgi:hypothetical protein